MGGFLLVAFFLNVDLYARRRRIRITTFARNGSRQIFRVYLLTIGVILGAILSLHVNVNVPDFFKEGGGYT